MGFHLIDRYNNLEYSRDNNLTTDVPEMLKHLFLTGAVGFTKLTVELRVRRRGRGSSSCAITIFSLH